MILFFTQLYVSSDGNLRIDNKQNKLVGVYLCFPFIRIDEKVGIDRRSNFSPIQLIMEQAKEDLPRELKDKKILQRSSLVIDTEYRGNGIARNLMSYAFHLAKTRGFEACIGHSNSAQSQKLNLKYFEGKLLKKVLFEDFSFYGEKVFASIQAHHGSYYLWHSMIPQY